MLSDGYINWRELAKLVQFKRIIKKLDSLEEFIERPAMGIFIPNPFGIVLEYRPGVK